jgi:hypothetical protein
MELNTSMVQPTQFHTYLQNNRLQKFAILEHGPINLMTTLIQNQGRETQIGSHNRSGLNSESDEQVWKSFHSELIISIITTEVKSNFHPG